MDDKLLIRLNVVDRYYPLKIDRDEEEKVRKAASMINDKVLQYKQRYADKDSQDFLAMAALQFIIKHLESEDTTDISPIIGELKGLNDELEEFISQEQLSSLT
jgi:cell division protein ZapA